MQQNRKKIYPFEINITNSEAEPIAEDTPHIYNVEKSCKMAEFSAIKKIERSHIKKGYWYYQWENEEYIKSGREVMVYREVNKFTMSY